MVNLGAATYRWLLKRDYPHRKSKILERETIMQKMIAVETISLAPGSKYADHWEYPVLEITDGLTGETFIDFANNATSWAKALGHGQMARIENAKQANAKWAHKLSNHILIQN